MSQLLSARESYLLIGGVGGEAYDKYSVLINAILMFCRDCGLAG